MALAQPKFGWCADGCGNVAVYARGSENVCEKHLPPTPFAPFLGQQTLFMQRRERIVFYGGAGGGGKSLCGRMKFVQQLMLENQRAADAEEKGERFVSRAWGVYFRRKTKDMRQVWDRSHDEFPRIDPDAVANSESMTWTFPNCGGAKFQFSHMEHPLNRYDHKSAEYSYAFFDELTEFEEEMFSYIDTRVRTDDPVLDPYLQVCAGSNPDGKHMAWVKRRFIDCAPPETVVRVETKLRDGRVVPVDQVFIPAKLDDNPKLMASGQYEASLLNKPAHVREAILNGNWNFASGGFFSEVWDSTYHVVADHEPPKGAMIFRAADWGIRSPGSIGWFYVDSDGAMTCFRHLRFQGLTVDKVALKIRDVERFLGLWDEEENSSRLNFARNPLDAQCFAKHGIGGVSGALTIAGEFKKRGIHWKASKKDRYNGLAQITRRLGGFVEAAFEGAEHPTEVRRPLLRFCETCTSPIETIPVIMPSDNDPNDVDTKADDHDVDMTMYACLEVPIAHAKDPDDDMGPLEDDDFDAPKRKYRGLGDGPWTR
jgi:hypothetical protein